MEAALLCQANLKAGKAKDLSMDYLLVTMKSAAFGALQQENHRAYQIELSAFIARKIIASKPTRVVDLMVVAALKTQGIPTKMNNPMM